MIVDDKGGPWTWALERYVAWKLRTAFRGLWARGALPPGDEPLLVYANHSNFWDGFVAHAVVRAAGRDGYAVMEEQHLARYRFLRRLGAFSLRRGEPASALETFRHARVVLTRPGATVVLFPQGRLVPTAQRPLVLERGVEVLTRLARVRAVPMYVRYAVFEHEHPDVLVHVGAPHGPAPLEELAARLTALGEASDAVASPGGLDCLMRGRAGVAQRWDRVRGRLAGVTTDAGDLAGPARGG